VADLMIDSLAEKNILNFKAVIAECSKIGMPANVPCRIPSLDHRIKLLTTPMIRQVEDTLTDLHGNVIALIGQQARVVEATIGVSQLSREELVERMRTIKMASSNTLQGLCTVTGEITRKRRKMVKTHTPGLDGKLVEWENTPVAQKDLFGEDIMSQCNIAKKGELIFTNVYTKRGLCEGAVKTMASARKEQSNSLYAPYIERYALWAEAQGAKDPFNCDISMPINFIQHLKDEVFDPKNPDARRSFSILRVIVSALSTVLSYDSQSFGKHHMMNQFMKGLLHERPIKHRYKTQWDMNAVLNILKEQPWATASSMPLDLLAKKTMLLYLLATANRNHVVTELRISKDRYTLRGYLMEFKILDGEQKRVGPEPVVSIREYVKNRRICPVWYVTAYIERTKLLRGSETKLFISSRKPHKAIATDTARRWVRETLKACGVDINRFGPGSTRGASASAGSAQGASLKEILCAGGWRRASTFQDWYKRPITPVTRSLTEVTFR